MAKELDTLMERINGLDGFNSSIARQKSTVAALEEGIWTLSEICRDWRVSLSDFLICQCEHVCTRAGTEAHVRARRRTCTHKHTRTIYISEENIDIDGDVDIHYILYTYIRIYVYIIVCMYICICM